MRKKLLFLILILLPIISFSQIPDAYYDTAEGLDGTELREALRDIIDDHTIKTYAYLWTAFQSTDATTDGDVWDMYSDIPGGTPDYTYTFITDQCGNYNSEADCYNREHSFPKSWFGGEISPMYTDLFHIVASDGYVNGQRGNYPYGEVGTATWTSTNGSKKGNCSYPGYTGIVFEPIDEYKGDFARNYFYMLTRYMDDISGWSSPMLSGGDFSDWARLLLMEWSENDTVSQKEIDRNNAIYGIQVNRNPFIDHPEYVQSIWDFSASVADVIVAKPKVYYQSTTLYVSDLENVFSQFTVYSLSGILMYNSTIDSEEASFPVELNNGMYILNFSGQNIRTSVKLLVINN